MTRGILEILAATFVTIGAVISAFATDQSSQRSVYVAAGRESRIASYGAPNEKCKTLADPDIQIVEWPSYGTLGDKSVRVVAERIGVARRDHPCLGRFINSLGIYYRPKAGFHGSDRIRLRVTFPSTGPGENTVIRDEDIFIGVR